jgi:hypothetical protein
MTRFRSTRIRSLIAPLFALGSLLAGCDAGTDEDSQTDPSAVVGCRDGMICDPPGMPFVRSAFNNTDASGPGQPQPGPGESSGTLTQPQPGKLCAAGHLVDGWAWLTFGFASFRDGNLHDPLDATALGIERIEFTIDTPPQNGVYVQLVSLVPNCTLGPVKCQHWGFFLNSGNPPTPFRTNQNRVVTARLSEFLPGPTADPSWTFDPSHLSALAIGPGALASITADYAFCVSNLRFLDAAGNEVVP